MSDQWYNDRENKEGDEAARLGRGCWVALATMRALGPHLPCEKLLSQDEEKASQTKDLLPSCRSVLWRECGLS